MRKLRLGAFVAANLLIVPEIFAQNVVEELVSDVEISQSAHKPVLENSSVSFTASGACKGKVVIPLRNDDIYSGAEFRYRSDPTSGQLSRSEFLALGLWFRSADLYLLDPVASYAEELNIKSLYNRYSSKGALLEKVKSGKRVISLVQKNSVYVEPRFLAQQSGITCGDQSFSEFLVANGYWQAAWDNDTDGWRYFGILNSVGHLVSSESLSLTFTEIAQDGRDEAGSVTAASFQLKQRAVMTFASAHHCRSNGELGSEVSTLICKNSKPFKIKYSVDVSGGMTVLAEVPQPDNNISE